VRYTDLPLCRNLIHVSFLQAFRYPALGTYLPERPALLSLTLFECSLSHRYTNTSAVISRISYIDGEKGVLRYRGYPIEELAAKSNFMEVSYLTLFGNLPTRSQVWARIDTVAVGAQLARMCTHMHACAYACVHARVLPDMHSLPSIHSPT